MLELKFVRAHPEIIRADLNKRGDTEKLAWVDEVLEMDRRARELTVVIGDLRNRRNVISREISRARKAGDDTAALIAEAAELPARIKEAETERDTLTEGVRYRLMRLPNILHESVPVGKDDTENVEIKR
ncbi:MAG: serine--tRNA ligase, partial [Methanoculleus bourgensis]|nr:serine--tRNA ligase [Methanoculleus bourgensis]